jgi:hypothetical protein
MSENPLNDRWIIDRNDQPHPPGTLVRVKVFEEC